MGFWSFYILAKLGLHAASLIGLHWWPNLAFALVMALPIPHPMVRRARFIVAVPVAAALLWYDSYWPAFSHLVAQWSSLTAFSPAYLAELAGRAVSWPLVAALVAGGLLHVGLSRRLRMGAVALVALLLAPLVSLLMTVVDGPRSDTAQAPSPDWHAGAAAEADAAPVMMMPGDGGPAASGSIDDALKAFQAAERSKRVILPTAGKPEFDVVVLSVCSLGWEDLRVSGLDEQMLLSRFDVVLRNFNSGSSYSAPGVLRALRATCGQVPEADLEHPADHRCFLFAQLADAGWLPRMLLNHDGRFEGFTERVRRDGGVVPILPVPGRATVAMRAFDESPVYADDTILAPGWERATKEAAGHHVALFYNTVSLHEGNHLVEMPSVASTKTWKRRAERLMADLERFYAQVERSGRPTVLLLMPEHGAAMAGDALQIPGLREYPSPQITHVPAGVALIGFGPRPAGTGPIEVSQVTGHAAMADMLAALMAQDDRTPRQRLAAAARSLPTMPWVAENGGTVVMRRDGVVHLRDDRGTWMTYPAGGAGRVGVLKEAGRHP